MNCKWAIPNTNTHDSASTIFAYNTKSKHIKHPYEGLWMECKSVSGGILSLPPETLIEVFQCTVAIECGVFLSKAAPLNISQTCHYWRLLALANGYLWARVRVLAIKENMQFASLWLERARNSPLDIKFDYRGSWNEERVRSIEPWYKALVSKQMSWKKMDLPAWALPRPDVLHDLSSLEEWESVHLLSFAITGTVALQEPPIRFYRPIPAFFIPPFDPTNGPIAPRLTTLKVGIDIDINENELVYRSDDWRIQGLMAMLQHSPNLEIFFLKLNVGFESGDELYSLPPIHLIHLKEFFLAGIFETCHLLTHVIMPALERLELRSTDLWNFTAAPKALKQFLRDSGTSNLTTIDINCDCLTEYGDRFDEEDHVPILEALPNVRELMLRFPCGDLTCSLLELPNGAHSSGYINARGLCPKLNRLAMVIRRNTHINALRRLLSSRFDQSEDFMADLDFSNWNSPILFTGRKPPVNNKNFKEWRLDGRLKMRT